MLRPGHAGANMALMPRRPRGPNPLYLLAEVRSAVEAAALLPTAPALLRAPRGDGHHVVVIPPFGAGDAFTTVARNYLRTRGYVPHKWAVPEVLGIHQLVSIAIRRLEEIVDRAGGTRVTLIGHSLGGIYAREIARHSPHHIRQIITVGSPFAGDLKSNYVWPMYEAVTGTRVDSIPTSYLERMNEPPPVRTTAIFSRTDGVAAWWSCVEREEPAAENIEVPGSHIGLLHNPAVLYVIADRLAQPEDEWTPFERSAVRALLSGDRRRDR